MGNGRSNGENGDNRKSQREGSYQGSTSGQNGGNNSNSNKRQKRGRKENKGKKRESAIAERIPIEGEISLLSLNARGYARHKSEETDILGKKVMVQKFGAEKNITDLVFQEVTHRKRTPAMIFLQETWLQQHEKPLPLHGYTWFGKSRTVKKRGGRFSGGLGVWVHSSVAAHIKQWAGSQKHGSSYGGSEGVQWLLYSRDGVRRALLNVYRDSLYFRQQQGYDEIAYWSGIQDDIRAIESRGHTVTAFGVSTPK